jgi:cytoskeletal protein CcmA (bactofilin family)
MFTRRDSQASKPTTDTRTQPEPMTPVAPEPEPFVATPVAEAPPAPAAVAPVVPVENVSVIAAGDVFEGKLTTNGVRVQGTVRGTIESKSNIQVDEDASVEADLTAENVTIAGTYKGNLNCNGRLEITASGRASGELDTGRILLHEGGFFEGTLHMKPPQGAAAVQSDSSRRRYSTNKE